MSKIVKSNQSYSNGHLPYHCSVQPRSQGLSSLPPLVVGRKTLVVAGHMTTQNLGGKKNLLGGRGGRVLCLVDVTNFVGFKSSSIL